MQANYLISQEWESLNFITGEAVGTEFTVQNNGRPGDVLLIARSSTQPAQSYYGWEVFCTDEPFKINSQADETWVRYYRQDQSKYPANKLKVSVSTGYEGFNSQSAIPDDIYTSLDYLVRRLRVSINPEVFDGNKAITVQPFTEVNSKLGNQFEAAFSTLALQQDESVNLIFQVGPSNDVLIKDVISQFNSERVHTQLFRDTIYTGGTPIDIYNLSDRDASTKDVVILGGAVVADGDEGTQVSPTITTLGASQSGNRVSASVSLVPGVERVLAKGVDYLYRITNVDVNPTDIAGVATWYQGPLSTQTNPEGLG